MQTVKAAVVNEFGKPLVIEEVPVPKVVPGLKVLDCQPRNWIAISGVGGLGAIRQCNTPRPLAALA